MVPISTAHSTVGIPYTALYVAKHILNWRKTATDIPDASDGVTLSRRRNERPVELGKADAELRLDTLECGES